MKIGDETELKKRFEITAYDPIMSTFSISILDGDKKVEWMIPIFIGLLGIYVEGSRFCTPGDHLPKNHPNYHKMLEKNKYIVEYKGKACRIQLPENFRQRGIYLLTPVQSEQLPFKLTAIQMSQNDIDSVCRDLLNTTLEGAILTGNVVRMYTKIQNKIKYYESFPNVITKGSGEKYVVIHDEITNVEYSLPYEYLKNKL